MLFLPKKNDQNYLILLEDFALAQEPRTFSIPKTYELANIPGTLPQFILKTKIHILPYCIFRQQFLENSEKRNGLTKQYGLRFGNF